MRRDAREVAIRIVRETGDTSQASYFAGLPDPRDRALARFLAAGCLKWRGLLDYHLSRFSSRELTGLGAELLCALRVGAFQILFTDVPHYAAVDSVVRLLQRRGERSFANGVLRAVARHAGHLEMPSLDSDPVNYLATRFSHPPWVSALLVERFGVARALAIADHDNRPSHQSLRVNSLRCDPGEYLTLLHRAGYSAAPGLAPGTVRLREGAATTSLPGYSEGLFVVQDEGAGAISAVVGAKAGERVWDVCAAPGGKTTHLAEMMDGTGEVVATDVDRERARMVEEAAKRLGLENVTVSVMDATHPPEPGQWPAFDRILLDAPCSGLGVLRKHPDLRWNRRESDIPRMASRQSSMLRAVARHLWPGGILVYSTCTLTREENEGVWEEFLRENESFCGLDPTDRAGGYRGLFARGFAGEGYRYILPSERDTDGFFVACATRKE